MVESIENSDDDWGPLSNLPGNPLMWVLIVSELMVFGGAFAAFAVARALDPQLFLESQNHLDRLLGAINTLVLITSSFCAAIAVRACTDKKTTTSRYWLGAAFVLGVVFLSIKIVEYQAKLDLGFDIETNTFFTLYYLITGFHFFHVIMGLIILVIVAINNSVENLETGTAFWHMVDLVWVILFPLIYLLR